MGWKEKDWKKNQNQKSGDSRRDIEIEMLKIQGLLVCPKCDLTVSSVCSKCSKEVEVSKLADGCVVQITKCAECTDTPVIKDVCTETN